MDGPCVFGVTLLALSTLGSMGSVSAAVTEEPGLPGLFARLHRTALWGGPWFAMASLTTFLAAVLLVAVAC